MARRLLLAREHVDGKVALPIRGMLLGEHVAQT